MSTKRTRRKPEFNARIERGLNELVSVCKLCLKGIFKRQSREWLKGKGLVHTDCLNHENTNVA